MRSEILGIGIIGCGYISDYYVENIKSRKNFKIEACYDIDKKRLLSFSKFHKIKKVENIEQLTNNQNIDLILNLTPPEKHFEINKKVLINGKSVFCEKPITLSLEESKILFALAKKNNLNLWSAPSVIFNDFSKSFRRNIFHKFNKENLVGYGFFETPNLAKLNPEKWVSPSGAKWPLKNELKHGPIIEHSGYLISLICSIVGPVKNVTSIPNQVFRDSDFEQYEINKNMVGFNHSVTVLSFENSSNFTLIISEQSKHKRCIEIYDGNISLNITDIRDDHSTIIYSDSREKSFITRQSNRIYKITRIFSNLLPAIFAMPILTSNPFMYDRRIKNKILRVKDIFRKRKSANFSYGLEALILYKNNYVDGKVMEDFFLHCNELTLLMNKECKKEKVTTSFDHKKLLEFLYIYDNKRN